MTKKTKLTKGQQRQVYKNHQQRLQINPEQNHEVIQNNWQDSQLGESQQGLVISRFGKRADVEDLVSKKIYRCHIRRTVTSVVCGDRVMWRMSKDNQTSQDNRLDKEQQQSGSGIIEAVQERHSALTRPDYYDGVKTVAANIDQIIIVSAIEPELSLNILDRYLIVAEKLQIKPVILINKIDLLTAIEFEQLKLQLICYQQLNYQVIYLSAKSDHLSEINSEQVAINALQDRLQNKVSIFVGQSGVGKSSLVNSLMPEVAIVVQELSENSGLGQHTTTAARLYHLPYGGDLIDSPGVREFGMWHLDADEVMNGFIEFQPYFGQCKFRDCKHQHDPQCAIVQAVKEGKITQSRYQNYLSILASIDEQRSNRSFTAYKKVVH